MNNKHKNLFLSYLLKATVTTALLLSFPVYAATSQSEIDTVSEKSTGQETTNTPPDTWKTLQKEARQLIAETNDQFLEDQVLANLLAIPYEKRQYYYPFLHEEVYLPHKIKSHPQIIVWKGKKPTVIAPHLKEFAEKYLDDLPASFYYFMDPDYWTVPQPIENNYVPNLIALKALQTTSHTPTEVANAKVRPLTESYILPPDIQKKLYQTDLTTSDVQNLKTTLGDLAGFIDSYPKSKMLPSDLRDLIHPHMTEAIALPFKNWFDCIKQTDIAADFEKFIQEHGWKNSEEFIQKADILLRAVRVNDLSIPQAMSLSTLRKKFPLKEGEPITSTQMYYLMYNAKPGDALFVAPYVDELRKTFKGTNFIRFGLVIYID